MQNKEFKCFICGEVFIADWSEEEALEELHETFGEISKDDCCEVCDDCYRGMFGHEE